MPLKQYVKGFYDYYFNSVTGYYHQEGGMKIIYIRNQ